MTFEVFLPSSYYFALALTLAGFTYAGVNAKKAWSVPYGMVLFTFFGWYLIEPVYTPDTMAGFSREIVSETYWHAAVFVSAFMLIFPLMRKGFAPSTAMSRLDRRGNIVDVFDQRVVERLVKPVALGWLMLAAIGIYRMDGDIIGALFPLEARSGMTMWSRAGGAAAGATGFLISTANYLYILFLAAFGFLLPRVKRPSARALIMGLILISWPYALLSGTRNITLAVVLPMFASLFLFSRLGKLVKVALIGTGFVAMDFLFRVVVSTRNTGLDFSVPAEQKHLGLNMASELSWINYFIDRGLLEPSWGGRYFAEIVNFVPRAIWPEKPLIGIDYAILRGFGMIGSDTSVSTTVSTGMIGQGIVNFGPILGPIAAATLMAIWANFLVRLRIQGTAPRVALFCVGLGLTFNLGRDITLLVIFPMIFGYALIRLIEYRDQI